VHQGRDAWAEGCKYMADEALRWSITWRPAGKSIRTGSC
jgi:hypothetical protein